MMVGIFGGGMAHLRFANGRHTVIDGMSTAPLAARPDTYRPVSDTMPDYMETVGRENAVGIKSVAAPGNLKAWCEILRRFGTFSLADVMEPAIRHASRGFTVSAYLQECASDVAGVYAAAGAGLAVGAGVRAIVLTNKNGAVLELSGRQVGLMANADLSGLAITVK